MQNEAEKVTNKNASSLIDLKAELFRKQEEFKTQKLQSHNAGYIKGKPSGNANKKPSLFSKKNPGVGKRAEKDYEEKKEEEDVFERSRKALENKARLYEKITTGSEIPEEDGSDLYLVDFQKKVIDDKIERREKERQDREDREKKEADEDRQKLKEPVPPAQSAEDEWVDYEDSLGRSRRCLRKDLAKLQHADSRLRKDIVLKQEEEPSLLSADMRREIERKKWEEQEMETMEKKKEGPIHYADVRQNEVRTHGVGFYKFDKEEEVRQEQMDKLKQLRDETLDERSKRERIKEKRKAALAARLAKVKQRKRAKLGLPEEDDQEEKASSDEEIGPKLSEQAEVQIKQEPEPLTRDDSWRKTADLTREWDKGKERTMERSEKTWLEKQRAERETEFAPPSFYYEETKFRPQTASTNQKPHWKKPAQTQETVFDSSDNSRATEASIKTEAAIDTDRSSQIVADVIMKRLKEYRDDSETLETNNSTTIHPPGVKREPNASMHSDGQYSQLQANVQDFASSQFPVGPFSVPPPPLDTTQHAFKPEPDQGFVTGANVHGIITPPDITVPPPLLTAPVPVPAKSFHAPIPNLKFPPPMFNVPASNVGYPDYPIQNQGQSIPGPTFAESSNPMHQANFYKADPLPQQQTSSSQQQLPNLPPKRVIPKMDIIDRRLMENEDDPPPNVGYQNYSIQNQGQVIQGQANLYTADSLSHQQASTLMQQLPSLPPKRVISKMDIIDTRLMENEDD